MGAKKPAKKARTRKVKTGIERFSQKLTEHVVHESIGGEALPVVEYLKGRKDISEFQIAKSIKAEVGYVRQMLYKLQNQNLVTYYRKKDREKGWYISYWSFNPTGMRQVAVSLAKRKLDTLRDRLSKEEKNKDLFYICPKICVRLDFDQATEVSFKCPECGEALNNQDNTRTIELLRERISEMKV